MKTQLVALYFAARDPRTPIVTKCLIALIVGYSLSPIDLIPDVIPVLGLLDDGDDSRRRSERT
ncbi:YkvA family protein [Idiomarina tyrosinivorans]|nr:YkvA family protein [Idiomarina tyrosinivorans]